MSHLAIAAWDWPAFSGGGIAALLHTLAAGLAAQGAQVTVWTRGGGERSKALAAADVQAGVQVVPLAGRSWRQRGDRHWSRGVTKAVGDGLPDAVIVGSMDALPGVWDALGGVVPVACIAHGRDITADLPAPRDRAREAALALPVRWLCLTRWMAKQLADRGVSPQSIDVVPAAVPAPVGRVRQSGGAMTELLTVGRLIPRKGHDTLLASWPRLKTLHPELRWHIVGDGPSRPQIAAEAALLTDVVVHGQLSSSELERRWDSCDLFVMSCREEAGGDTEGYGLVFLEAAARGVLCVGGASAGATEAVAHVGGEAVANPSSPDALVAALHAVLASPTESRRRAAHAQVIWRESGQPTHLAAAVLSALHGSAA